MTELKEATLRLKEDTSSENQRRFAQTLKEYVDQKKWVFMPCNKVGGKYRMQTIESRGMLFAVMFSDPSEVRNPNGDDIANADINSIIEPVFQNRDIDGVVIDPYTTMLCLEKRFILKCLLHSQESKRDDEQVVPKDWGVGIPIYSDADLMTEGQLQNFALSIFLEHESKQSTYRLFSVCDTPGTVPTVIADSEGMPIFILVKAQVGSEKPILSDEERAKLIALGQKYCAECLFAPMFFEPVDAERRNAGLALKGDKFYCGYKGLEPIEMG